jgi:hypothetical protein
MRGYGKPVEKLQTATGTKDKIAQHWIEILLERARQLKTISLEYQLTKLLQSLQSGSRSNQGTKLIHYFCLKVMFLNYLLYGS